MIDNDAFYEGIRHNIEQHKRHLMGVLAVEKGDPDCGEPWSRVPVLGVQ